MPKWTAASAAAELRAIVAEIGSLSHARRLSAPHMSWIMRTLRVLEQVFGRGSRYYLTFSNLKWYEQSSFIFGGWSDPEGSANPQAAIERRHQEAYVQQLDTAKGLLEAAFYDLEQAGLEGVYEGKDTGPESSAILKLLSLIETKLRKVIRNPPTKEREVQDSLEGLLISADIEYSRETDSIEYSSKTYTPDFTFHRLDLALELKFCNRQDREKEIIAEINDDILAYRTKYGNAIFVVYDTGFIRDIDRFTATFESQEGIVVRVIKH